MADILPEFDITDEDFDTAWDIKVTSKPLKKGDPIVSGTVVYNSNDLPTAVTYRLWDDSTESVVYTYSGTSSVTFKGVEYINYLPNLFEGTIQYRIPEVPDPPITDIELSNTIVNENDPVGVDVGTLTSVGGTDPYTYLILADPANAFVIVSDKLKVDDVLSAASSPYDVTIRSTDSKGKFFDKLFSITVVTAFENTRSVGFIGMMQYCRVPSSPSISLTQNFSISLWTIRDSSGGTRAIASQEANNTGTSAWVFTVRQNSNNLRVRTYTPSGNQNNNGNTQMDTNWNHYVICFGDAGDPNVRFYINGVLDATWSETLPLNVPSQGLYFGASPNTGSATALRYYFRGAINNVSYWNKKLSITEVQEIYNGGSPDQLTATSMAANLTSWWKFGTGDTFPTLNDTVGSNPATMVNMIAGNLITDVP